MPCTRTKRSSYSIPKPTPQELRLATPHELDSTLDDEGALPQDLDEPLRYSFRAGDAVWVRTSSGDWHPGIVSGQIAKVGQTREKEGLFYPVVYCDRFRKYFAPLNGDIKPDTSHTRQLLEEAGWL